MGTLIRHGEGEGAVWTYTPIGRDQAYETIDTASLLLLAVEASRLVWHEPHEGVRNTWRLVLDVARGRRSPLSNDEVVVAEDKLPPKVRKEDEDGASFSIKITAGPTSPTIAISEDACDVVAKVLYLAWDYYHKRYDDAPLGDSLPRAVIDLLGKVAFLLRDDDVALKRLRDLEVRCLIHGWTHTLDVVPGDVIQHVVKASSANDARERACAWRLGPEPAPFPKWAAPPPALEELARREAVRLAAEAEQRRWGTISPEERAEAERESAYARATLRGLINRDVQ